jgi:uncharacterized protein VirK/YbjX
MTVMVRFLQSGSFNSGEFLSLDLEKISSIRISRQRNTSELLATTPENPRPNTPYIIATRDKEYELQAIINDLQQLRQEKKNSTYEITDTEAHLVTTV